MLHPARSGQTLVHTVQRAGGYGNVQPHVAFVGLKLAEQFPLVGRQVHLPAVQVQCHLFVVMFGESHRHLPTSAACF